MYTDAALALFAGVSILVAVLLVIVLYVLYVIGYWKIFSKAGEPGWKSIVPFLNAHTEFKVTWKTSMFWLWLVLVVLAAIFGTNGNDQGFIASVLGIAIAVLHIVACSKMSKAFGKGVGYTIGLVFLEPFFIMALGFGDAVYQGPQE